jgi:long-chain acyl-CoA synthetase
MLKKILIAGLFFLCSSVQAIEINGVKLDPVVHLGNSNLILNGAGVRTKWIFDLYVAALYTAGKKSSAEAVLADAAEKRIALHILSNIGAENLLYVFNKAIENNQSEVELQAMEKTLHEFGNILRKMNRVSKGDVILFDYQPGIGTQISVNGSLRGTIPGPVFAQAWLKIWLGEYPVQQDVKLKLLGGK